MEAVRENKRLGTVIYDPDTVPGVLRARLGRRRGRKFTYTERSSYRIGRGRERELLMVIWSFTAIASPYGDRDWDETHSGSE